jgi:hypothetical protein
MATNCMAPFEYQRNDIYEYQEEAKIEKREKT